jgi:hypothetical protein
MVEQDRSHNNMAHDDCMQENKCYKYTLRICNIYCFSTAIIVSRTRLNIALYIHGLSCSSFSKKGKGRLCLEVEVVQLCLHKAEQKNIVRFIKSQRLRWAGHVIRMETTRTVKKLTEWETCSSRRPVG